MKKANLRGLVYERWRFGGSERLSLPRSDDYLSVEAEHSLAEVLSTCGIEQPILVGHSDGARIALLHAAAYPDESKACVCLAAHVYVEDELGNVACPVLLIQGEHDARIHRHTGALALPRMWWGVLARGWPGTALVTPPRADAFGGLFVPPHRPHTSAYPHP